MFGPLISDISATQLIQKDVLANARVHFYPVTISKELVKSYEETVESASGNSSRIQYLQRLAAYSSKLEEFIVNNEEFHKAVVSVVNSIPSGRILILVERYARYDTCKQP